MFSTKIVTALALLASPVAAGQFAAWKAEHGKHYSSHAEEAVAEAAWNTNLEIVNKHNAAAAAGTETYTLAMNKFADLTNAEFRALYLRPKGSRSSDTAAGIYAPGNGTVPDTMDWRELGYVVTPIKNQAQCGSCWAFSAVAAMEGAYNFQTKTLHSLSEQELVDCVNDGKNTCMVGGEMSNGVDYIASMEGLAYSEEAYPYTGKSKRLNEPSQCQAVAGEGLPTNITGHTSIASGDETALLAASAFQTVISVGIDASLTSFQLYSGGVYAPTGCSTTDLDHGVAVVGYNTMADGGDYWIVRNSWDTSWGVDGYMYMARGDGNMCGIATDACFANV